MMYLLDTNVLSELRKVRSGKADPAVATWTESIDAAELFVSTITIMELELGVLRAHLAGRHCGGAALCAVARARQAR